jgi:hypothetical protein
MYGSWRGIGAFGGLRSIPGASVAVVMLRS